MQRKALSYLKINILKTLRWHEFHSSYHKGLVEKEYHYTTKQLNLIFKHKLPKEMKKALKYGPYIIICSWVLFILGCKLLVPKYYTFDPKDVAYYPYVIIYLSSLYLLPVLIILNFYFLRSDLKIPLIQILTYVVVFFIFKSDIDWFLD